MKKKYLFLLLIIVFTITIIIKIYPSKEMVKLKQNEILGIYVEQENGSFVYRNTMPQQGEGYTFNASQSSCNDRASISWDEASWSPVISKINRESVACYLFFDISVPGDFEFLLGGKDNPEYTNTKDIKVYLSWNDPYIKEYCVTTTDDIETCTWKPVRDENSLMLMSLDYNIEGDYTLSDGEGEKTLYAFLRNNYNRVSKSKSDKIILDQTIEGITSLELNNNDGYTQSNTVNVSMEWKDSDITHYCLKESNSKPTSTDNCWITTNSKSVNTTHTFSDTKDGVKTLYGFVKDRAGNITNVTTQATDTIIKDTTPANPTKITLVGTKVNGVLQTEYTHSNTISVTVNWTDLDVGYYCLKNDATAPLATDSCWVTPTTSTSATNSNYALTTGEGVKTVYVYLKDLAGNITTIDNRQSSSLTLDTVDPTQSNPSSTNVTASGFTINIVGASDGSTYSGKNIASYCFSYGNETSYECGTSTSKTYNGYGQNTSHTIYVKVRDKSGRESQSKSIKVTTLKASDTTLAKLGLTSKGTLGDSVTGTACSSGCTITNQNGLYETEDDDGKSYIFRGTVDNNWVKFGKNKSNQDIWWRIIRINGDGTIRLIYSGVGASVSGNGTNALNSVAYNTSYGDNTYVGYYYGTIGGKDFSKTHSNTTASNIATQTNSWFSTTTNLNETAQLNHIDENAGFCNNRQISKTAKEWYSSEGATDRGTGTVVTAYKGWYDTFTTTGSRRSDVNYANLKCSSSADNFEENADYKRDYYTWKNHAKRGNKALDYPVGQITVDEVILAGGFGGQNNTGYWLNSGTYYWTMSPRNMNTNGRAYVFVVRNYGYLDNYYVSNTDGVRPVINLKADTTFAASTGNGTWGTTTNPYIVV